MLPLIQREIVERKHWISEEEFVNMITNGTMLRSYEDLIKPVKVLAAIKTAYETGEKVEIQE